MPSYLKSFDIVFPVVLCLLITVFPYNETFALVAGIMLGVMVFQYCVSLSFSAFGRFSRYKLSQRHQYINWLISIIAVLIPFVVFLTGGAAGLLLFVGLALHSYSLAVSPNQPEKDKKMPWYHRPFMVPIAQIVLLGVSLLVVIIRVTMLEELDASR